jgi:integrase
VLPSPEQVHRLAELLPDRLSATVYLAAGCGLRLGEMLGLEVGDVDFGRREGPRAPAAQAEPAPAPTSAR